MNVLNAIKVKLHQALAGMVDSADEPSQMVRPSADPKFGDYQINCAMSLKDKLGKPPRDIAADIIEKLEVSDFCETPEVAGPGFINLRLKQDWLSDRLTAVLGDKVRLGVDKTNQPKKYVIDYSAPNVAKPMHVGHIRSTVIGDSLYRVLQFLGHEVISDNHIGDWGTQFGMIIYGWKNFRDEAAYKQNAVEELAKLYRLVVQLIGYHSNQTKIPELQKQVSEVQERLEQLATEMETDDKKKAKQAAKASKRQKNAIAELNNEIGKLKQQQADIEANSELHQMATDHPQIGKAVLAETAKLHRHDEENLALWKEFLPPCLAMITRVYDRLNVTFDNTLGESFYHDRLAKVVKDLQQKGFVTESDGAQCIFLDGFDQPMIIQKSDGAFLYSTTDLATIQYRMETWKPDAILYVVDHRQGLHFEHLFTAAKKWGFDLVELTHVSFGTVLGKDKRPYKTRSGDTVGLWGLLDEAESRALDIVKKTQPELATDQQQHVATVVGISALKYADLSQNRTSDYEFSYEKMLATEGNTATYMQYAYARICNIIRKSGVDIQQLRNSSDAKIILDHPAERALAQMILRFPEALDLVTVDYRPNQLTNYLFDLGSTFSTFYSNCPVVKAETEELRNSRLLLIELTGNTLRQGLALLGIAVVDQM